MRLECLIASRSHIFGEVSQFEIALKGGSPEFQDLSHFFDPGDITVVRVPSRLDVMGGIADYSGSLVLELPLREATLAGRVRTRDAARMLAGRHLPGVDARGEPAERGTGRKRQAAPRGI